MAPRPIPLDTARIVALYHSGLTCRQIARVEGGSTTTVWRRLMAAGVDIRRPGQRHTPRAA